MKCTNNVFNLADQDAESSSSQPAREHQSEANDQLTKVNMALSAVNERCSRLEAGQNEIKAMLAEILRRMPPPSREHLTAIDEGPPDYLLLPKEVVDRFQRSTDSVRRYFDFMGAIAFILLNVNAIV